jgi:hypothetical protein
MEPPTVTPVQEKAVRARFASAPPDVATESTLKEGDTGALGPLGSVSASDKMSPRVIGSGPLLVTATVQTTLPPALTVGVETDLEMPSVYWQGI